ncbi:hypothetical protein [Proteus phage PM 116]|uniref:Uncharacterized protein n=1 Tax=Proteus phage PM 116 TaxID=1837877 RepID=A0A2D0VKG5_9CAUD|nr:hypothetical protein HOS11_gp06 [Proteus phage PM 116]ANU80088.1 hypothetical protein [Proteus phage PM 116]
MVMFFGVTTLVAFCYLVYRVGTTNKAINIIREEGLTVYGDGNMYVLIDNHGVIEYITENQLIEIANFFLRLR